MEIKLDKFEINKVLNVIRHYDILEREHQKYTEQLNDVQSKLKEIGESLLAVKNYEDKLMKELHEKYGDFDLKELLVELSKQIEDGNKRDAEQHKE